MFFFCLMLFYKNYLKKKKKKKKKNAQNICCALLWIDFFFFYAARVLIEISDIFTRLFFFFWNRIIVCEFKVHFIIIFICVEITCYPFWFCISVLTNKYYSMILMLREKKKKRERERDLCVIGFWFVKQVFINASIEGELDYNSCSNVPTFFFFFFWFESQIFGKDCLQQFTSPIILTWKLVIFGNLKLY